MSGRLPEEAVSRARALLDGQVGRPHSAAETASYASRLAALLWEAAALQKLPDEQLREEMLARLMNDPAGQAFSNLVADRAYRTRSPERLVAQIRYLLDALGTPQYLSSSERLQLGALRAIGATFPKVVARGALGALRQKTRAVILPAREPGLTAHLARRRTQGIRVNLNWLGEAALGEEEAARRVDQYVALLQRPDVPAISVKVSTLTSQLRLVAWEATLERLRQQLRRLYRAALSNPIRVDEHTVIPKLVNLDMEAYRDLRLTLQLFRSVLSEPEFKRLSAGVVLQAYVPDSFHLQQELTAWALKRVAAGGAPIRLRLVKGANLAAELVEASLRNWPVPVYPSKSDVDGNFKRMVAFGCAARHAGAVQLGIASHNVFDLAYGMILRAQQRVKKAVSFELLEGMSEPLLRAVQQVAEDVLVYVPVVDEHAMQPAIAYLIRRLDENTGEENFLRHSFSLQPGDAAWRAQRRLFRRACKHGDHVSTESRRQQNRAVSPAIREQKRLCNEPDTDFACAQNRDWIQKHLQLRQAQLAEVKLQIAGQHTWDGRLVNGVDPSRPGVIAYRHPLASPSDVQRALSHARQAIASWEAVAPAERATIIRRVAEGLRAARGELCAAMVLDAAKRVEEADAEVSEAIDFAEYYARCALELFEDPTVRPKPKGVVLVAPPWNFPLAIPAGGTLAALASGNVVLLKPALETPFVAELFARICWEAGIPLGALQFVICEDAVGSRLISDARVDAVILTGATSTAQLFYELRPDLDLMAETGGKNSMIVTGLSDRDLAVQAAIHSAFSHSGQKCSATSLLILEPEIYDDPDFRRTLRDAAASLPVGSAWDLDSFVTPLVRPPAGALLRGLTRLEPGESWLLRPRPAADNPRLWSPGIKLGVREGSFTHTTELFGPVLGVMRAENLADAVRMANATPYGLTSGLQSLDEREQLYWLRQLRAGNLYVNRGTTGAIVNRQPFGGYKASNFGPGAKAGGPNYVAQLVTLSDGALPQERGAAPPIVNLLCTRLVDYLEPADRLRLRIAISDYAWALEDHFGRGHDPSRLVGQANIFCYRPLEHLLVRVAEGARPGDTALVCAAALTCSEVVQVSAAPTVLEQLPWLREIPGAELRIEAAPELAQRLRDTSGYFSPRRRERIERIRLLGSAEKDLLEAARHVGVHVAAAPPLLSGRWELVHYVREQSISIDYHRYGNLAAERLLPVAAGVDEAEATARADRLVKVADAS